MRNSQFLIRYFCVEVKYDLSNLRGNYMGYAAGRCDVFMLNWGEQYDSLVPKKTRNRMTLRHWRDIKININSLFTKMAINRQHLT